MIRINLLKFYAAMDSDNSAFGEEDEKKHIYIEFSKRLLVLLIGPLGLFFYESSQIPAYKNKISQMNIKLTDLKQFNDKKKGLAEEIKKYEQDQIKLNAQMNFMKKVSNEKINELKLFLYLQEKIPASVWLNKLELKGSELTLNAESDISGEIAHFLDILGTAPFLAGVSPLNQETKIDSIGPGVTTTTFNVKANFVTEALSP